MKRAGVRMSVALGLLIASSGVAAAQGAFADLQTLLTAGDAVSVEGDAGARVRGRVENVGTTLRISVDGVAREFAPQQVREVRRRGDSLKNGVTIGLLAGGVAGAVFGGVVGPLFEAEGSEPAGPVIAFLALGLSPGAGIGAGLDAAVTGSTVVYRRQTRSVSIAPLVTPRAQGIRVGLAF